MNQDENVYGTFVDARSIKIKGNVGKRWQSGGSVTSVRSWSKGQSGPTMPESYGAASDSRSRPEYGQYNLENMGR